MGVEELPRGELDECLDKEAGHIFVVRVRHVNKAERVAVGLKQEVSKVVGWPDAADPLSFDEGAALIIGEVNELVRLVDGVVGHLLGREAALGVAQLVVAVLLVNVVVWRVAVADAPPCHSKVRLKLQRALKAADGLLVVKAEHPLQASLEPRGTGRVAGLDVDALIRAEVEWVVGVGHRGLALVASRCHGGRFAQRRPQVLLHGAAPLAEHAREGGFAQGCASWADASGAEGRAGSSTLGPREGPRPAGASALHCTSGSG
mmetsp:Transcript_9511/g.30412  ORF Transcript_9511/g.30412 Transcript_9511/m.30412 type:complete len:261 (-) Transcript_9511:38-820(-)